MDRFNTKKKIFNKSNSRWTLDERLKLLMIIQLKKSSKLIDFPKNKYSYSNNWKYIKKIWFKNRTIVQIRSHYQKSSKIGALKKYLPKFTNLQKITILLEIIDEYKKI